MDKKIRTVVIGCGHLGKLHLKNLLELTKERNDMELTGIYDINHDVTEELSKKYNISAFTDISSLLENADAAIIVSTTSSHFEIAQMTINKNIHTFIEKPVTDNLENAHLLQEMQKDKNIKIQIGHIERFNPALLSLQNLKLNPKFIECHRLSQFNPRGTDVSVIQDLMIHDIDIILSLVNSDVKQIDSNGVEVITEKIDIANTRLQFENGCVANITSSRISQKKMRKMRIFQEAAYISLDFLNNSSEIFRLVKSDENEGIKAIPGFSLGEIEYKGSLYKILYEQPQFEDINPMKYEQNKFFDSIINNTTPEVTLENGIEALIIADKIITQIEKQNL